MHPMKLPPRTTLVLIVIWPTVTGCAEPPDKRLAEFAQQSVAQQARQNEQLVQQNQQVAEAARELVTADAHARQEAIQMQREVAQREAESRRELAALQREVQTAIQQDRQSLNRQHEDLEHERRQIAQQRQRDPILAAAISSAVLVLACLAPLLLCWYVLHVAGRSSPDDAAVSELLIQELAGEQPRLLPRLSSPPALEHHQASDAPQTPP
jgi:leucyl-tRNA synthetase